MLLAGAKAGDTVNRELWGLLRSNCIQEYEVSQVGRHQLRARPARALQHRNTVSVHEVPQSRLVCVCVCVVNLCCVSITHSSLYSMESISRLWPCQLTRSRPTH